MIGSSNGFRLYSGGRYLMYDVSHETTTMQPTHPWVPLP